MLSVISADTTITGDVLVSATDIDITDMLDQSEDGAEDIMVGEDLIMDTDGENHTGVDPFTVTADTEFVMT